jgi:xanthine dehydrogenase accessory factor
MTRPDFHIVVFGNGHVGRALVQVLSTLPCDVSWPTGEHDFPATFLLTQHRRHRHPEGRIADAPRRRILVMTHSHALDFEPTTTRILARGDFRYLA